MAHWRETVEGSDDDISQLIGETISRIRWLTEEHRATQVGFKPGSVDPSNASRLDLHRLSKTLSNTHSGGNESVVRHETGVIDTQFADGKLMVSDNEVE
jgi:hypothetical protein